MRPTPSRVRKQEGYRDFPSWPGTKRWEYLLMTPDKTPTTGNGQVYVNAPLTRAIRGNEGCGFRLQWSIDFRCEVVRDSSGKQSNFEGVPERWTTCRNVDRMTGTMDQITGIGQTSESWRRLAIPSASSRVRWRPRSSRCSSTLPLSQIRVRLEGVALLGHTGSISAAGPLRYQD
jgi:hypothetical protein